MKSALRKRTEKICTLGILTALFVALSMVLRVPIFGNFYLCLGYIAMYMAMCLYGITGGAIVGTFGTIIYCLLISGLRGMPGWIVGNLVIAVLVGLWMLMSSQLKHDFRWYLTTFFVIIMATGIGMLLCKSLTEVLLYAQPFLVRLTTNLPAFISDTLVLCLSVPLYHTINQIIPQA